MSYRRRNKIAENWASHFRSMIESPAWSVLSLSARRFLDRLEIEFLSHGARDNGKLPLTFDDLVEFGIHRASIAPAMREVEALGFAFITRRGHGGKSGSRQPNLWRITYLVGVGSDPTHEWRKIETVEQARTLARVARLNKSERAVEKGREAANVAAARKLAEQPKQNHSSDAEKRTTTIPDTGIDLAKLSMPDSGITAQVQDPTLLSISGIGAAGRAGNPENPNPEPRVGEGGPCRDGSPR